MLLSSNVYIPYDVNVLSNGRDEMLRSIGLGTNVGITIFFTIGGIFIVAMIIRKLSK